MLLSLIVWKVVWNNSMVFYFRRTLKMGIWVPQMLASSAPLESNLVTYFRFKRCMKFWLGYYLRWNGNLNTWNHIIKILKPSWQSHIFFYEQEEIIDKWSIMFKYWWTNVWMSFPTTQWPNRQGSWLYCTYKLFNWIILN
jgi:hypothetical protein